MTIVAPEAPLLRPVAARPLDVGDTAPIVHAPDHTGAAVSTGTDQLAGKPILLLFCPALDEASLVAFRDSAADLASHHAALFAISRHGSEANAAMHARLSLPFAILADARADIFKGYGVDPYPAAPGATLFILDAGHRVARVLERMAPAAMAKEALAELRRHGGSRPATRLQAHPPVLILPRMLGDADCDFLAEVWRRQVPEYSTDGFTNAGTQREAGDFKVVHGGAYGRAVEYIVQDESLERFIDGRLRRRFREYGEQLYVVERGTAIVWSASLLHEVLPVTKGRRLVLGVHMFAKRLKRRSNASSSCRIDASIKER